MFCQYDIYFCFIKPTKFFTIAASSKSVLKSGRLKYSTSPSNESESYSYHRSINQITLKMIA